MPSREIVPSFDLYSISEWNEIVSSFGDGNIYQLLAYAECHWPGREVVHFTLRDSGELIACAQIVIQRIPVLGKGIAYLRWGPLVRRSGRSMPDALAVEAAVAAIRAEFVERRSMLLQIVPRVTCDIGSDTLLHSAFRAAGFLATKAKPYRTICVHLSLSIDVIRKNFDKKWRNQLTSSEKMNLTIEVSRRPEDFEGFLKIYDEMVDRKQFDSSVDPREFYRIHRALANESRFLILSAYSGVKLVASLIIAAQPDTAIYLLGASTEDGRTLKASYLLHWRAIIELKQLGCNWYDLGGIDPVENPGGYRFKSGFGGKEVSQIDSQIAGRWPLLKLFSAFLSWKSRSGRATKPREHQENSTISLLEK